MSSWNDFFNSYANSGKKKENKENSQASDMKQFEDAYFGSKKKTELEPETPSHIVIDEEAEKYVEEHIVNEPEQIIETEVDAYEAAVADGGCPIELQETQETHLVDGPTPEPKEEPEFTAEELEEFKRLNNIIEDVDSDNDGNYDDTGLPLEEMYSEEELKTLKMLKDNVNKVVEEQPVETKVKKVKVTKPKTPKKAGRPKTKK